jgi:DNA-damage-inducible protein J
MSRNKIVAVRLDADLKDEVGEIFLDLGLTTSQATVLFYKQVLLHRGLPFELRLPAEGQREAPREMLVADERRAPDGVALDPLFSEWD